MASESKRQVVVVTGASAGVGRAVVRAFAREGARVALLARGRDGLEAAAAEVRALGGEALALPTDVADAEQVAAAARAAEERFGPFDVWVNNAMTSVFAPAREITAEEFERVTKVTYLGYVYGTKEALARMLPRDRGVIVQVSSALAYRSIPLQSAYCAAKHAIKGFTESLRTELLHDRSKVKVTMVHLPAVNTPQFGWVRSRLPRKAQPVPPIFQPELAARAILHAARHPRRSYAVSWSSLKAILGNRVAPGLLDRYLARAGYEGQQQDEHAEPDRPDNLFAPVPGDHGAHGAFDARARRRSSQFFLATRGPWIAAAALLAGASLAAVRR